MSLDKPQETWGALAKTFVPKMTREDHPVERLAELGLSPDDIDAGFEVIYTGCHQTPEQIVAAAIQEDVDLVGLSCLSGAHRALFPRVVELLHEKDAGDISVIGGGIIPEQDFQSLYDSGIKAIFTPGASLDSIVEWINTNIKPRA